MAAIGLAHRPTDAFVAEWMDVEVQPDPDEGLRDLVDQRRKDATETAARDRAVRSRAVPDEPSPDGWLAGEPLF